MKYGKTKMASGHVRARQKLDVLELSLFCHQFALVMKSGINPVEGIPLIAGEMVNPLLKNALTEAGTAVVNGDPLCVALGGAGIFPSYMISMIRLGEAAGSLEHVMENLSIFYEKEDRLSKRLRNAISYPLLLLVLMLGVIILLIVEVLPMFAKILASLGGDLPDATRILLGAGDFFSKSGFFILFIIILLATTWLLMLRTEKGRLRWDAAKLKLPLFGRILTKTAAARFSNGLSIVLQSGMGLVEGLDEVKDLTNNLHVQKLMLKVSESIREGSDLGSALAPLALFPPLFTRMIQIGQKAGELDKMMGKISSVYEGEVENSLEHLTNAIEPILVIILSIVVGVILLAVMLPLINIMGSIG